MSIAVTINHHDTPADLYAALSRAFTEHENAGTRWITFNSEGVQLTFYATKASAEELNDEIDEQDDADPNEGIEAPW